MALLWSPPNVAWSTRHEARAASALDLLTEIAARHADALIATSLQAEDAVLANLNSLLPRPLDMAMIDTGRLPEETLEAKVALEARYGRALIVARPDAAAVQAWVAAHGENAFYDSLEHRRACCDLRKVAPLNQLLDGRSAWVSGQRREQSSTRVALAECETDAARAIAKFNPLAAWSAEDVWAYVQRHDVPLSPLYARGYASIGCAPCSRAIRVGEEARAGRWWWEEASGKECGLHPNTARFQKAEPA